MKKITNSFFHSKCIFYTHLKIRKSDKKQVLINLTLKIPVFLLFHKGLRKFYSTPEIVEPRIENNGLSPFFFLSKCVKYK